MTTGDTGTGTVTEMNYFKPWISDEEPKAPDGWGVGVFLGHIEPFFICVSCLKPLIFREEYIYKLQPTGPEIRHNKKECCESLIV